jgi:tryptophan synthase beta subunit
LLARTEGIIPALESSHAIAEGVVTAATHEGETRTWSSTCSGRGDKDVEEAARLLAERQKKA